MTTLSDPATLRAHAKLTLELRVTGVRADGFHLIDAEMVSLDLHDLLRVRPGGAGLTATGPYAPGMPLDGTNLVARALERTGRSLADTGIEIDKRIPHGGGLGGGSTDAAAVMRWAGVGTSAAELGEAATLGADISFCLVGDARECAASGSSSNRSPTWSAR